MENKINYQITTGTVEDINAIAQFQVDMAAESEGTTLDIARVTPGVAAVMDDPYKGTYIIARADGQPIGSLMLTREWSDWTNRWYWWIQSVYVRPEYRGKGAYRAMYAKIKEMAHEQGVTQVYEGLYWKDVSLHRKLLSHWMPLPEQPNGERRTDA